MGVPTKHRGDANGNEVNPSLKIYLGILQQFTDVKAINGDDSLIKNIISSEVAVRLLLFIQIYGVEFSAL